MTKRSRRGSESTIVIGPTQPSARSLTPSSRTRSPSMARSVKRRRIVRRTVRRSRRRSNGTVRIRRWGGFANSQIVRLKYVDNIVIDPGAGSANCGYHLFRVNSIYDPDTTGTGHQPMGRDALAAVYTKYLVLGSHITATIIPNGANMTVGCRVVDTSSPTTVEQVMQENAASRWTNITALATRPIKVRAGYRASKYWSSKEIAWNHDQSAAMGASPTEDVYFQIWGGAPDASTNPAAFTVQVTIAYTVKVFEPLEQALS